uniref:Uncharacterized protein n=1 Tax=Anguilla anguilla TaxID=7936 RepID=A0A0E9XJV9_ANGAN
MHFACCSDQKNTLARIFFFFIKRAHIFKKILWHKAIVFRHGCDCKILKNYLYSEGYRSSCYFV